MLESSPYILIVFILTGIFLFLYFVPLGLWVTAYFSGVKVSIFRDLVAMRLRKVAPAPIIRAAITATKAGIHIDIGKLEAHFLAGGNIIKVIQALISADKANLGLTFERAAAIEIGRAHV